MLLSGSCRGGHPADGTVLQRFFLRFEFISIISLRQNLICNMKTVASFTKALLVLLIPVWVCQCSGNYNLVDYKEYRFGELDDHISYNYNEAGELKSKTRFRWGDQNTLTLIDVNRYETGVDTIETTYEIFIRDSTDYEQKAYKEVTSYTLDGIKRLYTCYGIKDGKWDKSSQVIFDGQGRKIESNWEDREIHYFYYDSSGRCIGSRTLLNGDIYEDGFFHEMDTVIFSEDGRLATRTESTWNHKDSIWEDNLVYLYETDKHGRITSVSYPPSINKIMTYRYDRKGRLRCETIFRQNDPGSEPTKDVETVNRYLFGLKICSLKYRYEANHGKLLAYLTIYRYDLRHRLLLEENMYDHILDGKLLLRKIWTYEKTK